jgi:hypothetical protein
MYGVINSLLKGHLVCLERSSGGLRSPMVMLVYAECQDLGVSSYSCGHPSG